MYGGGPDSRGPGSDISHFLVHWLRDVGPGESEADFNADGMVNSADIGEYLGRWVAAVMAGGC